MLVKLSNVKKEYKDFKLNCSLEVKKGQITGYIGANGAGKSTTFKAILGLINTSGGSVEIFGKSVDKLTTYDKENIGVVSAEGFFSKWFTIKDVIAILKASYRRFDETSFIAKCKEYNLPLDKKLKDFSTGMKAKLKVLTAMSYGAKLLILDEPTSGLDVITRNEILDELRNYMDAGDRGIIISSHISSDLENICDDLYFIQNGEVVFHEEVALRNESSFVINDSAVTYLDEPYNDNENLRLVTVVLDYSAQNGLGGYNRNNYRIELIFDTSTAKYYRLNGTLIEK